MITALYHWAKYIAKKDEINIDPDKFNKSLEKVVEGKDLTANLEVIYQPISHLFESNVDKINLDRYQIKIKLNTGSERNITNEDLKFIMFPQKRLTGKAQQSIGTSIFARTTLGGATKEAFGEFKKQKKEKINIYITTIPENNLMKFWRKRLLDTYFQSASTLLSKDLKSCSFCGLSHKFENLRFNPPINIFVENVTNYNSYLSNEPSHSICGYCSMLFMRTLIEDKGPEKIFFSGKKSFIYILPFDSGNAAVYEDFSRRKAENLIETELGRANTNIDALEYLLFLPLLIYKGLPSSISDKLKPFIYIAFADKTKQAEEISNCFVITRFDYLAQVGRIIYEKSGINEIYNFQERLSSFVEKFKQDQKVNGYKLVFRFLGNMLSNGEIDFSFLHKILRNEISSKEKPLLRGYTYLKAFLEAKKEVSNG